MSNKFNALVELSNLANKLQEITLEAGSEVFVSTSEDGQIKEVGFKFESGINEEILTRLDIQIRQTMVSST